MKNRIFVISVKKPSNAGGAEVVWYNLKKKGFRFENISLDEKNLPIWIKLAPEYFHIKEIIASKWLLKKAASKNPKIIIYDKIFGWRKIKTKARLICFNHGSYTLAGLKFRKRNFLIYLFYKYIIGFVEKRSYINADKIIAVSESVKLEMINYFNIPEDKIVVINNGVDLRRFKPIKNKINLRKKYGLPLNKKIIFFPGRPSFGKGFDIAKKVLERLGDDYFMFVLGEGKSKKNLKFIGKIPNEKIPEIYNCADICLFPSRYEGNSLSVLESAACGVPLLLSNTGLIRTEECMKEFVCLTVEEYVKKLKKLFENNNLKKASKKWRKFSERFNLETQIYEIKKIMEKEIKNEK